MMAIGKKSTTPTTNATDNSYKKIRPTKLTGCKDILNRRILAPRTRNNRVMEKSI